MAQLHQVRGRPLINRYRDAIITGDMEELRNLYMRHPIPQNEITTIQPCICGCSYRESLTDLPMSRDMCLLMIELNLLGSHGSYLAKRLPGITSDELSFLLHSLDRDALRDYRHPETDETLISRLVHAHVNMTEPWVENGLISMVQTVGISPVEVKYSWGTSSLLYVAINYGMLQLAIVLHELYGMDLNEEAVVEQGDQERLPLDALLSNIEYWHQKDLLQYHPDCLERLQNMRAYIDMHGGAQAALYDRGRYERMCMALAGAA